jgi:hypothetical protein
MVGGVCTYATTEPHKQLPYGYTEIVVNTNVS